MSDLRAASVACIGSFVAALSTSLVAVAAPVIATDLHATQAEVGWVLTAFLVAVSCVLATAGRLADLLGRKRVYLAGFIVFVIASALSGLAPSLRWLVGARVIQGLGASTLMATGPAIITRAFGPARRARGLGVQIAATYLGLTIGPTLGGVLASAMSWRAIFFAVAAAAAVGTVVAAALLEADEPPASSSSLALARPSLDVMGSVLFAIALGALLVALRRGPYAPALAILSLVALGAFAWNEARHAAPIVPPSLLRVPSFTFGIVGAMFLYVVTFVLSYLLPFHLQRTRGLSPGHAGALMTAQPATMAVFAPVSGWLADRFGPRGPLVCGMSAIAAGMVLVAEAAGSSDMRIVFALAVMGLGAGLYVAPNSAVIMAAAPRDRQGTAAAMAATARNVGMATGVALAVVLHETVGFRGALFVGAAIAVAGAVLGAVRPTGARMTAT